MKKVILAFSMVCLLLTPAYAGFWFGGQVGPNFTSNSDVDFKNPPLKGTLNGVTTNTGYMLGAIMGYDFDTRHGFPAWSEYFGVALDFSYNPFSQSAQTVSGTILPASINNVAIPEIEGYQLALALLLKAQYPYMKSVNFPKGRLFPYVMVGPAVVWTTSFTNQSVVSEQTSTDIGVVAETGINYFVVPNFAIGVGFRYRHTWGPSYDFRLPINYVNLNTNADQYSVLLRMTYHF